MPGLTPQSSSTQLDDTAGACRSSCHGVFASKQEHGDFRWRGYAVEGDTLRTDRGTKEAAARAAARTSVSVGCPSLAEGVDSGSPDLSIFMNAGAVFL